MKFQLFGILSLLINLSISEVESGKVLLQRKLVKAENVEETGDNVGQDRLKESPISSYHQDSLSAASTSSDKDVASPDSSGTVAMTVSDILKGETVSELENVVVEEEDIPESPKPGPGFALLGQFKGFIRQIANFMGATANLKSARTPGERRQKGMEEKGLEDNLIQPSINYRDELRTTVGAVLGKEECLKQAACRAGKYLKSVKGKEIIIVILEKFSPEKWIETVQVVKDAAIRKALCQYKCFDH